MTARTSPGSKRSKRPTYSTLVTALGAALAELDDQGHNGDIKSCRACTVIRVNIRPVYEAAKPKPQKRKPRK